jgi:hypothetical protein
MLTKLAAKQPLKLKTLDHFGIEPIAVAARSKARTVFARSNTEIVGSNLT